MSVENACGEASSSTDADGKEFSCPACDKEYSDNSGLAYHMRRCCPDNMVECEICSKLLLSKHGVETHKAQSHDIGRVEKSCECCGDTYTVKKYRKDSAKYCSEACRTRDTVAGWNKKDHPVLDCERCGSTYTVPPHQEQSSRYCSVECKNGPRATVKCEQCGNEYGVKKHKEDSSRYCSLSCRDTAFETRFAGENSPRWKGGKVGYYGANWRKQREKTLKRDSHTCQDCGSQENLHVHHVHKIRLFDNPEDANYLENLTTLCQHCHKKWEGIPVRPQ